MALSIGELVGYLSLDESKFKGSLSSAVEGFRGGNDGMIAKAKAGGLLIGAGLAAGAVIAGKALYEIGSTFDDVSDGLRVKTGATGKTLEGLVGSVKKIGTEIPASFDEIGETLGTLNQRLGLTGPALEKLTKQFVEAGRITGQALDIKTFTAAFNAFNVKGAQTSGVMDQLFRVSQSSGLSMNDLAASLARNAPALGQFGFGIKESAGLLGQLESAGLNGNKTVATLSKAMVTFAKDGKAPKQALMDTVSQIEQYTQSGNKAAAIELAAKIFGTRGAGQFVAAVQSGKVNLEQLNAATKGNSDTILKAADDTADFAERWQVFKNQVLVALEPLATRVFNAVGDGMAFIGENTGPAIAAVQQFIAQISSGSGSISSLGTTVSSVFTNIQSTIASAVSIIQSLWATFGDTLISYATATFGNLQTVLGGAFDVIAGIFKTFAALLQGDWSGVWDGLKQTVSGALDVVKGLVAQGMTYVKLTFSLAWDAFGGIVRSAWDAVKSATTSAISAVVGFVTALPGKIGSALASLASTVVGVYKAAFTAGYDAAVTAATRVITFVTSLPGKIKSAFGNATSILKSVGSDIVAGLRQGIVDGWHFVTDKLEELIKLIPKPVRKLLGIESPSKVFAEIGKNVVDGLIKGLRGSDDELAEAMLALAKNVGDHAGQITKAQSNNIKGLVKDYTAAVNELKFYQDQLTDLYNKAAALRAQVTASITATGNVTAFQGKVTAEGVQMPVTFADIVNGLASARNQAQAFNDVLIKLKALGLNQDALDDIISKGPAAGIVAAQAILDQGAAGIKMVNVLQAQLAASGLKIGQLAANNMYAAAVQSTQGFIKGLQDSQNAIAKQMEAIARSMVAALKKELGIKSPSKVLRDMGAFTGEGFRLGLADTQSAVERQMAQLVAPPRSVAGVAPWNAGQGQNLGASGSPSEAMAAKIEAALERQTAAFTSALENGDARLLRLSRTGAR